MVREDIIGGLKNALERGNSIESARQSFINAGYSVEEVNEAVNFLRADSVLVMNEQPAIKKPQDSIQPSKNKSFISPQNPSLQNNLVNSPPNNNLKLNNQPIVEKVQVLKKEIPAQNEGRGFFIENWKIISLVAILIILIVVFALVLLFSETIASWFA